MSEKTIEERLSELKQKRDHVGDPFGAADVQTLVEGIEYAMSHGGDVSVAVTPVENGYKITVTDSEGNVQEATVQNGGDAYEVYKSTVPQGQPPMSKTDWLASLKGEQGNDAVNPFKGWFDAVVTGEAGSRAITSETQNLPASPVVGDYAYVKTWDISGTAPSQTETAIAKIYECTTAGAWSDSGRTANTSNVQTFASSEEVNDVHIINDLTTGGTEDVLSAEQGKTLNLKMERLIGFQQRIPSNNNGYTLNQDGELITNGYVTQRGVSDFLPVTPRSQVLIKSGVYQGGGTGYSYAAFYSSANEASFVSRLVGTHNTEITNTLVSIPSGANYMRVVLMDNTVPAILSDYEGTVKEYVDKNIEDINDRIDALPIAEPDAFMSDTSENAVQNKVIKSYIDSVTGYPITILPSHDNGYTLNQDGELITNGYVTQRGVSDFLPVSGEYLYIKSGVYQGGGSGYSYAAFYSSANEASFVSRLVGTHSTEITNTLVSIPSGANYMRVVLMDNTVPAILSAGAEKSIAQRLSEIASPITKNFGKSIVVFGGSHTARNNADAAKNVWRDKLAMDVYTAGVGSTGIVAHVTMDGWTYNGTTYYTRGGGYNDGVGTRVWDDYGYLSNITILTKTDESIILSDGNTYARDTTKDYVANAQTKVSRLVTMSALDKDIYLVWLSTNDYVYGYSIGTFSDYTEADNYDTTKIYAPGNSGTLCGGFNFIVKTIRDNNPTAEIYVFTSLRFFNNGAKGYNPYTTDVNSTGMNFYQYYQELLKAAQVAGCAILDQFMLCGIDVNNYTEFYVSDNLHLKESGYERIADVQADFLANGR